LTFVFFEGAIALATLLALAELVNWWAVLVLPTAVAAMVKINDVIAGFGVRSAAVRTAAREAAWRPQDRRSRSAPRPRVEQQEHHPPAPSYEPAASWRPHPSYKPIERWVGRAAVPASASLAPPVVRPVRLSGGFGTRKSPPPRGSG
jgi:hypothetical protein